MPLPTKEEMRARFWALKGAIDAREAQLGELHAALEPKLVEIDAARAAIKALNAEPVLDTGSMFEAKQELAFIARGLGNQVGEPA